jgi:hypothetical protein
VSSLSLDVFLLIVKWLLVFVMPFGNIFPPQPSQLLETLESSSASFPPKNKGTNKGPSTLPNVEAGVASDHDKPPYRLDLLLCIHRGDL